jgi:HSP20 family protein
MNLVPYRNRSAVADPFREMLSDDFFYGSFFPAMEKALTKTGSQWFPALDISEDKNAYHVKADLPGIKKEDVHVSFEEGVLTIEGERKNEQEQKDKNYHHVERSYGKFVRSFNLGAGVDANAIRRTIKTGS